MFEKTMNFIESQNNQVQDNPIQADPIQNNQVQNNPTQTNPNSQLPDIHGPPEEEEIVTLPEPSQLPVKTILVCVPARGGVPASFMSSLFRVLTTLMKIPGHVANVTFSDMSPLDTARNSLLRTAVLNNVDYILWLDSDIILLNDHIQQLWKTLHEKDGTEDERFIVSGVYYEKEAPYDAVIRRKNHDFDKFTKVMSFPKDKPFTFDYDTGVGFGCVLMKSLPAKLAYVRTNGYPFRWDYKCSEDLYFCDVVQSKMLDHKGNPHRFKIWIDPLVQLVHIGGSISQWNYLHYKMEEYADITELSKYLKIDKETCYNLCSDGDFEVMRAWRNEFGKAKPEELNPVKVTEFYRKTDKYLYDLTWWWSHNTKFREAILSKFSERHQTVLDFGCGIGDYGINFAAIQPKSLVHFYDINEPNLDYLKWRIEHHGKNGTINPQNLKVFDDSNYRWPEKFYDLVMCFDVLEHIPNPVEVLSKIRNSMKRNGELFCFIAKKTKIQLQHISEINPCNHGFIQISEHVFVRDDSDVALAFKRNIEIIKNNGVGVNDNANDNGKVQEAEGKKVE